MAFYPTDNTGHWSYEAANLMRGMFNAAVAPGTPGTWEYYLNTAVASWPLFCQYSGAAWMGEFDKMRPLADSTAAMTWGNAAGTALGWIDSTNGYFYWGSGVSAGENVHLLALSTDAASGTVGGAKVSRYNNSVGGIGLTVYRARGAHGALATLATSDAIFNNAAYGYTNAWLHAGAMQWVCDSVAANEIESYFRILNRHGGVVPEVFRVTPVGAICGIDGITAPAASVAGMYMTYVDVADGDYKIRFADGTVKTIVTDT